MFALFTELPMSEVREIISADIIKAKKRMCYEITKFVRGEEDAILAQQMSENLFAQGGTDAPEFEISADLVENGINICELLFATKLAPSKSEARRLVEGGAISVNGEKVSSFSTVLEKDLFKEDVLLKKGKKTFLKVIVK